MLHEDTFSFPDKYAYYEVGGVIDRSFDATLTARLKVIASPTSFGVAMGITDGVHEFVIWLSDDAAYGPDPTHFAFAQDTTDAFHTYTIKLPAGGGDTYSVLVDGVERFSVTSDVLVPVNTIFWGDGASGGSPGAADWDFVRLSNARSSSIPEPATFGLVGIGMLGLGAARRLRRRSWCSDSAR